MSDTKKNALAELAEDLKAIADWTNGGYGFTAISKAKRIVAELAKVSDWHWQAICDDFCTTGDFALHCAIGRCLAIAEEGSEDDRYRKSGKNKNI